MNLSFVLSAARIGFERNTYSGREPDEVINVTVAVLSGTLSQEVFVRIYTLDSSARCKTNTINSYMTIMCFRTFDFSS